MSGVTITAPRMETVTMMRIQITYRTDKSTKCDNFRIYIWWLFGYSFFIE